jgi:UDP-glucose 4-epimerase
MPQQVTLVTGGAGYIGSPAVLVLKDHGWRPVVVDDLSAGNRNLVPGDVPRAPLPTKRSSSE